MADPKAFQTATVKAALRAFRRRPSRFLVADEVGLGKTVVAQQIIKQMMEAKNGPLIVFYVCNNLSIAAQNRGKLLEILPEEDRCSAYCSVDRLSLIPLCDLPSHPNFHLYTLTPDTSIPIWKNRRRDGRQEERALIHCLVSQLWPKLIQGERKHLFQCNAKTYWDRVIDTQEKCLNEKKHLLRTFYKSVRREFQLNKGQHVLPKLLEIRDKDELDLIAGMRSALATSAIEGLRPNLIIFDEFQNFRDLLSLKNDEAKETTQRMIEHLRGEGSKFNAALLLLSATPYRLYTKNRDVDTGASHHRDFFDLVEFLYGGDSDAKAKRDQAQDLFSELQTSIRRGEIDTAKEIRDRIQQLLCTIMSRTERVSHQDGRSEHITSSLPAPLLAEDIRVYRHFDNSIRHWQVGAAVPYWTSIPLPAQTMGPRYRAWEQATKEPVDRSLPKLTKRMRDSFLQMDEIPHPRLRSLLELLGYDKQLLPWVQPSLIWWPQKKRWVPTEDYAGKVLLFSRFRAVPQAIASLVSYAVESHLFNGSGLSYSDITDRRLLQPSPGRNALLGYFHPSPWLVENTDPLECKERLPSRIRRKLRSQLILALSELGITINRRLRRKRPIWMLLGQIEKAAGLWQNSIWYWRKVHSQIGRGGEDQGLGRLLNEWEEQVAPGLNELSDRELDMLVDYAFHSPGVAVGRALKRHWPDAVKDDGFYHTLLVSWQGLRTYLDNPLFAATLGKEQDSYPRSIMEAIRDGNLEALLDEQLWLLRTLHSLTGKELAIELLNGFQLRSGIFRLHEISGEWKHTFPLRCHVAMPMSEVQSVTIRGMEAAGRPLRTNEIRRAFNTPFWPNVLATTSVGQEGLDFHSWCSSIVHWDLPSNPVELEQREGRIQRFAGYSTRRKIVQEIGDKLWDGLMSGISPWQKLEEMSSAQLSDKSGLCPWWVFPGAEFKRYVFEVPSSDQQHRLKLIQEQRGLYRLALGQPYQEDLIDFLSSRISEFDYLKDITLELSAYFSNRKRN